MFGFILLWSNSSSSLFCNFFNLRFRNYYIIWYLRFRNYWFFWYLRFRNYCFFLYLRFRKYCTFLNLRFRKYNLFYHNLIWLSNVFLNLHWLIDLELIIQLQFIVLVYLLFFRALFIAYFLRFPKCLTYTFLLKCEISLECFFLYIYDFWIKIVRGRILRNNELSDTIPIQF